MSTWERVWKTAVNLLWMLLGFQEPLIWEGKPVEGEALADHPHTDPGDGRKECDICGKWVFEAIHSCKGVPVTSAAWARWHERHPSPEGDPVGAAVANQEPLIIWEGDSESGHFQRDEAVVAKKYCPECQAERRLGASCPQCGNTL